MLILRTQEVMRICGYKSRTSIHQNVLAGVITKPINVSARAVGWPDYEIEAIVKARIAGKSDDELRALVEQLHTQRVEG
jgi:prophage regulatory protein